jgi:hypothetical protein
MVMAQLFLGHISKAAASIGLEGIPTMASTNQILHAFDGHFRGSLRIPYHLFILSSSIMSPVSNLITRSQYIEVVRNGHEIS